MATDIFSSSNDVDAFEKLSSTTTLASVASQVNKTIENAINSRGGGGGGGGGEGRHLTPGVQVSSFHPNP